MKQGMMKAAWYERTGKAADVLVVGELPAPEPAAGELLVRVRASGVNPSDTKARGGARGRTEMPFPRIVPHQDGAGEVVAAGSADVDHWVGKRIWFHEAQLERAEGAAADYVVLPEAKLALLPDSVSFEEGACLGVPAMTAHRCIFADGPVTGKTVFVSGGAGAVGHYAIQFAKLGGARVITSVSRDDQERSALAAGADLVVRRSDPGLVEAVRLFTGTSRGIDRFVEVALGENLDMIMALLAPRGVIAAYSSDRVPEPLIPFWPLVTLDAVIRFVLVYVMDEAAHRAAADAINAALLEGRLVHNLAARYPLGEIAAAHAAVEAGTAIGKVVIVNES